MACHSLCLAASNLSLASHRCQDKEAHLEDPLGADSPGESVIVDYGDVDRGLEEI